MEKPGSSISVSDRERLVRIQNDESQQKIELRREFTPGVIMALIAATVTEVAAAAAAITYYLFGAARKNEHHRGED